MRKWIVTVLLLLMFLAASVVAQPAQTAKSLYERLGGKPAVDAVASGLVDRILADKRVNQWFVHAAASPENTRAYKAKLSQFICSAAGGPCQYTGKDMEAAHKGRGVTSAAFDAVVEDLTAQLDQLKVPAKEKKEVLDLVATLKPKIVQTAGQQ